MIPIVKNILLIDDDEITNFLNERIIQKECFAEKVNIVQSSLDALQYLKSVDLKEKPNLIFLDINMPAMNGWEFVEEYKKLDQKITRDIVLVMLTTSINPDDRLKSIDNPLIHDFKTKPLSKHILQEIALNHFKR